MRPAMRLHRFASTFYRTPDYKRDYTLRVERPPAQRHSPRAPRPRSPGDGRIDDLIARIVAAAERDPDGRHEVRAAELAFREEFGGTRQYIRKNAGRVEPPTSDSTGPQLATHAAHRACAVR